LLASTVIDASVAQTLNASLPMLVTLEGIVTPVSAQQLANA
jgi:hypothetical protein